MVDGIAAACPLLSAALRAAEATRNAESLALRDGLRSAKERGATDEQLATAADRPVAEIQELLSA